MTGAPAFVLNGRLGILAANGLGAALYAPVYADPARPANNARFVGLDPHATEFFRGYDKAANDTVALLRAEAGRATTRTSRTSSGSSPHGARSSAAAGPRTASHPHRRRRASPAPRRRRPRAPFESFPLPAAPARASSSTPRARVAHQDALNLLASWAASAGDVGPPRFLGDAEHVTSPGRLGYRGASGLRRGADPVLRTVRKLSVRPG